MKRRLILPLLALVSITARPTHADLLRAFHERQVLAHKLLGKLEKTEYFSAALGEKRTVFVYTPRGFSNTAARRYPVLVLLHGTPGEAIDWLYDGNAHRAVDNAIAEGTLPPCLIVLPDGRGPFYKGGSEWADAKGGKCSMETAVVRDLPQFLETRYHATTNPALWAIGGLSEGGYGAANLAVRHPERFQSAFIFSGDLRVKDSWGDATEIFGTDPTLRSANSPIEHLNRVPIELRKKLHFYLTVGDEDESDLITDAIGFTSIARAAGATVKLDRDSGGHKWAFWNKHFQAAIPFLGQWWKQVEG